jgi:hypothetical protein
MHCSHYDTPAAFYRAYATFPNKRVVSWEDAAALAEELKGKALVRFHGNDGVTVVSLPEGSERYAAQSKYKREHCTKLSYSVNKETAARFSAACKALGITQGSVLAPVIEAIIRQAENEIDGFDVAADSW